MQRTGASQSNCNRQPVLFLTPMSPKTAKSSVQRYCSVQSLILVFQQPFVLFHPPGAPKSVTSVSPAERRIVATHESGHALIGWLLEHTDALAKVTIIPRTKAALGFARTVPSDRRLHTQDQVTYDIFFFNLGAGALIILLFLT